MKNFAIFTILGRIARITPLNNVTKVTIAANYRRKNKDGAWEDDPTSTRSRSSTRVPAATSRNIAVKAISSTSRDGCGRTNSSGMARRSTPSTCSARTLVSSAPGPRLLTRTGAGEAAPPLTQTLARLALALPGVPAEAHSEEAQI